MTNQTDGHDGERAVSRLRELGSEFSRVAEAEASGGRWRPPRALVAGIVALVAVPVGYATAQSVIGDGGDDPPGVPASECPESNATWKEYGFGPPDTYAPACQTPEQIHSMMRGATVQPPPEVAKRMKEHGWDPAEVMKEQREREFGD